MLDYAAGQAKSVLEIEECVSLSMPKDDTKKLHLTKRLRIIIQIYFFLTMIDEDRMIK